MLGTISVEAVDDKLGQMPHPIDWDRAAERWKVAKVVQASIPTAPPSGQPPGNACRSHIATLVTMAPVENSHKGWLANLRWLQRMLAPNG